MEGEEDELEEEDDGAILKCPVCGATIIRVSCRSEFVIYPDGSEHDGDVLWEETDECRCEKCDAVGTVKDFEI